VATAGALSLPALSSFCPHLNDRSRYRRSEKFYHDVEPLEVETMSVTSHKPVLDKENLGASRRMDSEASVSLT